MLVKTTNMFRENSAEKSEEVSTEDGYVENTSQKIETKIETPPKVIPEIKEKLETAPKVETQPIQETPIQPPTQEISQLTVEVPTEEVASLEPEIETEPTQPQAAEQEPVTPPKPTPTPPQTQPKTPPKPEIRTVEKIVYKTDPNIVQKLLIKARARIQERKRKKLDKIMTLFETKSQITNEDVQKLFRTTKRTIRRYFDQLEKEQKIIQVGSVGRGVVYIKKP